MKDGCTFPIVKAKIATLKLGLLFVSDREYWYEMGRAAVLRRAGSRGFDQLGKAKNVILLVADGLGVTTNTAARVYKGQRHGQTGEEASLAWDNFPALAMTKVSSLILPFYKVTTSKRN